MKILYIAADTNALGGIQQYNRKLIEHLRARGDKVLLVELKNGNPIAKLEFIGRCLRKTISWKPNLVVCAHVNYAPIGLFLKKFLGRRYIVCTHGIEVWNVKGWARRKALREAQIITTVAEYTRDKIIRQLPETKDRIYFLYNPIDGERFRPKAKSPAFVARYGVQNKKVILTVARLWAKEGYKGYDRVIEAMPKVLEAVPNAVYLLGGKGDDAPRIRSLIETLGLRKKVIMAGYVPEEEIVDHYNLADVFVMPSKAEGAPAVYVEALACGVPVIAGNKDGSGTPLQNGEVGLLINPDSVDEIASAIIRVLKGEVDKRLLDKEFLRKKTLERFGLDRFPEKIEGMIQKFLTEKNP
ncbi:MAG: glycosyltransferase family 4 protein [Nanoarchaeota archaeon]|nr:glycosyltransferase family 4 protein [Nanoarchaeota archaeon]